MKDLERRHPEPRLLSGPFIALVVALLGILAATIIFPEKQKQRNPAEYDADLQLGQQPS